MKTATIKVYEIFGTSHLHATVMYRDQVLRGFDRSDLLDYSQSERRGLIDLCKAWAESRGFTHFRIKEAA